MEVCCSWLREKPRVVKSIKVQNEEEEEKPARSAKYFLLLYLILIDTKLKF